MSARSLLHLLYNGPKAIDVVETASRLGVLEALDRGPVTLARLCESTGARPNRMYKMLDCLESLGLVSRTQTSADRLEATYVSTEPLAAAAEAVVGAKSLERDRDRYDWRAIHGRLDEVLRGDRSIESFEWPPRTEEQVRGFEASMAAGCPPIVESFRAANASIFAPGARRWLDVGGGDGTLAAAVLEGAGHLCADVFNLPQAGPLVAARAKGLEGRLGFVPGDFLADPLPRGYDVVSFVRVLHDWDEATAKMLLAKAAAAVAEGGAIVVCEEFRNRERLAVQFFWTYFLMGVDACESRLRELEFYVTELSTLGFDDVRVTSGPFDVVVARRRA